MFHFSKQSIFIWISLTILIYFSELFPVSSLPLGIFFSSSDTSFRNNFIYGLLFVIVQMLSWVCLLVTSWTAARQAFLCFTISWSLLKLMSIKSMMPPNHLILCAPSFSCPQTFPASGTFPMSQLITSGGQRIRASASASVLPMNIQGWFPLELTDLISYSPRDSQESTPAPQFESINSSALSLLNGPTLTSIHDYWKNHSFNYMDFYWQSDVSAS